VNDHTAHTHAVAAAFDKQAPAFEQGPIQTDHRLLEGFVRFADVPTGGRVLDAGCGPGLLAEAFLIDERNYTVHGLDVSGEMVQRARARCERFADRAEFVQEEFIASRPRREGYDAAVSRLVLHHVPDPEAFVRSMTAAVRPGGVVALADHVADADASLAEWHRRVEVMRDASHTVNLSAGAMVDLAAQCGLRELVYEEHTISTDFDEWFSRGTHSVTRDECLRELLSAEGRRSRAWRAELGPDGSVSMTGVVAFVRGRVPG
jgi:2-polyprenyl-3-methyl-5-hydroxy-6-metoxy-1,4-benzoquinol methylase